MSAPDVSDIAAARKNWAGERTKASSAWGEEQAESLWRFYSRWDPVVDDRVVLDIGCYWGYLFRRLLRDHRPRRLIGVDIVPAWDQTDAWDWRQHEDVLEFHHTDVLGLELPDASVDLALCTGTLQYLPPEVLDESLLKIRRLLRPGGEFLLRTQVYTSYLGASLHRDYELPYVHMLHGEQLLRDRLEAATGRRPQYTSWLTPTSYLLAFARAGLEILDSRRLPNPYADEVQDRVACELPAAAEELRVTGLEARLVRPLEPGELDALGAVTRGNRATDGGALPEAQQTS